MKTIILILFTAILLFGQDKFEITPTASNNFVVTELKGKNAEEIYKKTIEWVNINYKNPKEVIKAENLNTYLRIEGVSKYLINFNMGVLGQNNYDGRYTLEFDFKDDKYRMTIANIEYYVPYDKYAIKTGWQSFGYDKSVFFNKKNEPVKIFKQTLISLPLHFNSMNNSLKDYILNSNVQKNNDW